MKVTEKTKVIYRKFYEGDIIAMFPEIPSTLHADECLSYQHIGQHGTCTLDIIYSTIPASETEYTPLHKELKSIGYNLQVCKKHTRKMFLNRVKTIKELRNDNKK